MSGEGRAASRGPSPHWLIIALVAAAAFVPELATGPSTTDSLRYNIVWADQWRELVAAGDVYPRWLPRSWDAMGSPTFYFYPPLFFWAAAAFDLLTLRALETGALLSLTGAAILAASGLAMRRWLLARSLPRAALVGAVLYMLAPYHLYDLFARGALAEGSAYAALPLVFLALDRVAGGHKWGVAGLAAAYAALVVAHLPVALLASPLVAAFAFRSANSAHALLRMAAGGAIGIGLAAIYLVPALTLGEHILSEAFSGEFYRPERWFFWKSELWAASAVMWVVIPLWIGVALLAAVSVTRGEKSPEMLFWGAATALMLLLIAGLPPQIWGLPFVEQVQFPWRLLVPVEFAAVTLGVLALRGKRAAIIPAIPLVLAWTVALALIAPRLAASWHRSADDLASVRAIYRDAPEYLPAGAPVPTGEDGLPNPSLVRLPTGNPVEAGEGVRVSARARGDGGLSVGLFSPSQTGIVARRFAFPHWRLTDGEGRVVAWGKTDDRRLTWIAPPGRSRFTLDPGPAPGERTGLAISAASLLMLLAGALMGRDKRRRAR